MKSLLLSCLFYFVVTWNVFSQHGFPQVNHYLSKDYGAGTQNWQIKKSDAGLIWIANNSGMLSFDGYRFELYQNVNNTIVRSFDFGNNDTIWVGSTSEIGFLWKNEAGHYSYKKISTDQDSTIQFSDVWKTYSTENGAVFFSIEGYIHYEHGKVRMQKTSPFSMSNKWGNDILHHNERGLLTVEKDTLKPVLGPDVFEDQPILKIIPLSDSQAYVLSYKYQLSRLTKSKDGIYSHELIKDFKPAELPNASIYDAIYLGNDELLFATLDAGIIRFDIKKGLIRTYSKANSLHNNSISNVFLDDKLVWYTSDNGFGSVTIGSLVGLFGEKSGLDGRLESVLETKNGLLVGGISGLFKYSSTRDVFEPIQDKNQPIQVWDLISFDNKTYAATDFGLFIIKDESYKSVYSDYYVRSVTQFGNDLVLGLGGAIQVMHKSNNMLKKGELFAKEFSTDIIQMKALSDTVLIVRDASNDLFRVGFTKNHSKITSAIRMDSLQNWEAHATLDFSIQNGVLFALRSTGFYQWNEKDNRFEKLFDGGKTKVFRTNESWVFLDTLSRTDKFLRFYTYKNGKKSYLNLFAMIPTVQINQHIFLNNTLYLTTNDGLFTLDLSEKSTDEAPKVQVQSIHGKEYGINFGSVDSQSDKLFEMPYLSENSNLIFKFSSTDYSFLNRNRFQFSLQKSSSSEPKWGEWSTSSELTFSNLSWNDYVLWVRTINGQNRISEPIKLNFTVLKPWYVSIYGIILWFTLFVGIVGFIVSWRGKVIKEAERKRANEKLEKERQKAALKEAEYKAEVAVSESLRKTKELDEAREIQQQFLPQKLPNAKRVEFSALQRTASEVGGDYYDFFKRDDDVWVAAVGDATGHGVGAGLMVSATKASLLSIQEKDLSKIGAILNKVLKEVNKNRRLNMALLLIEFIPRSNGDIELIVCGGGMPPIIVLRSNGKVEELTLEGLPLGVMTLAEYVPKSMILYPNDTIVVYSDGLPERPDANNEQLGYENMMVLFKEVNKKIIDSNFTLSAEQILSMIEKKSDDLANHSALDDDLTMMVAKIKNL